MSKTMISNFQIEKKEKMNFKIDDSSKNWLMIGLWSTKIKYTVRII